MLFSLYLPVLLPFTVFHETIDIFLNALIQILMSLYGIVGNFEIKIVTCKIKIAVFATSNSLFLIQLY